MFIECLKTYLRTDEGIKLMQILDSSEEGDCHLGLATKFRKIIAETSPEDHNLQEREYLPLAFIIEDILPSTNIIERTIKPLIGEKHTLSLRCIYEINPFSLRKMDTTTINSLKMSIKRAMENPTPTLIEHISDSPCSLFSRESKEDEISEEESKDELYSKYNGEDLVNIFFPEKTTNLS